MLLALSFLMYPAKHQMRTLSFYHERVILFYFLSRNLAGLKRFTIGIMYLVTFTLLQPRVKGSFLATTEYDVSNSCRWPFDVIAVPFFLVKLHFNNQLVTERIYNLFTSKFVRYIQPRSQGLSSSLPLEREEKKKEKKIGSEEPPWLKSCLYILHHWPYDIICVRLGISGLSDVLITRA